MTPLTDTSPSSQLKIYFDDRLTAIHSRPLYQKIIETLLAQGLEPDQFEAYFEKLFEQRCQKALSLLKTHDLTLQHLSIENFADNDECQETYQLQWLEIDKCEKTVQKFLQDSSMETLGETDWAIQLHQWLPLSLIYQTQSPVRIDFLGGKKAHRRQFGGGANQPLARAMGKLDDRLPTILDATAGLGGDSFVLASCGFHVTMLERDPLVACLLQDALMRAHFINDFDKKLNDSELTKITGQLRFLANDSIQFLTELAKTSNTSNGQTNAFDTIYLDPMYPEKKKNAATKKEMALLQQKVGPDLDSHKLLDAALKVARYRVVVKRPKNAPVINHPIYQPTTAIKSPNTRYDIYVIKALKKQSSALKLTE